jgi:glutathione S-transferase
MTYPVWFKLNHYSHHYREISMSATKPIILYSHTRGPVPWRVAILLEELKVPYESKYPESSEMNLEPFKSLNPNAKTPAIEDPNTGVRLFEVGLLLIYM